MMNDRDNPAQKVSLWRVSYGDTSMYFEEENLARHNFEAFRRADLNPRMEEYQLIRTHGG
jgi:hypothetical protein